MAQTTQVARRNSKTSRSRALRRERPWTADGDMVLLQLHQEGYTTRQIGAILNRTSQSVGRRLSLLRQKGFRLPEVRDLAADYAWPSRMGVVSGRMA